MKKLYIKIFNWEVILGLIVEFYVGNLIYIWWWVEIEFGLNLWRRVFLKLCYFFF